MSKKICPACHESLAEDADICPRCGLKNLNQIFLSKDEYDLWAENVLKPHIRRMIPRVFAGYAHALILTGSGDLYGIGNNNFGQLGTGEKTVAAPKKLAKNVKSAAAGYNYSIYVTNEGEVKLLGNGVYTERFPVVHDAEEVFADRVADVFWIRTADGRLLAFGDNSHNEVDVSKEKLLFTFPRKALDIVYNSYWVTVNAGTQGSSSYYQSYNGRFASESALIDEQKKTDIYDQLKIQFGERNLNVVLEEYDEVQLLSGSSLESDVHKERRFYQPELRLYNHMVFEPVVSPFEYEDSSICLGSGLVRKNRDTELAVSDVISEDVIKADGFYGDWFVLDKKGDLWLYQEEAQWEADWLEKARDRFDKTKLSDQVVGLSVGMRVVILVKNSGELLYGKGAPNDLLCRHGEDIQAQFQSFTI